MDEILAVHSMLHLIFHRNKNQHRRTKWWKWLSILKRATLDFARSGVKSHLATHVIPRCYIAFSTVVADNQFSALGVVLLAVLARLSKITGISHQKMEPATTKSRMTVAKEDLGERIRRIDNAPLAPVKISHADSKVSRVSKEKPTEKSAEYTESTEDGVSKTTSKKKKKKKNAIDDLFSGLF
ncbi:hypothetical protein N7489_007944 [Penicillium chrysogenum]|uniref:RNase MRP protein 1 RNA binding domain-containing protein n=1 Tax=Penicillium chrysogenum TaxID=5076 RepID=A0ABQ8WBN7_PENCH|nr:uncharacterized protein N7489_007944 [Penicillium chrysogenum]KAJ5237853.1 hypothetical protein N7489_007944 [Penicillium chrysogenum]KAJ5261887.1 hypothetical protein N7505_008754 [Penicillium chrysogenum]KAJ5278153.1 hypothetical protein N7524_004306 [Penicillium chrysogenum]KAJ6159814.1 hypothetical protein N7497_004351 [Penicillium chrysogenum]